MLDWNLFLYQQQAYALVDTFKIFQNCKAWPIDLLLIFEKLLRFSTASPINSLTLSLDHVSINLGFKMNSWTVVYF